jgi:hypothetical protein
LTTQGFQNTPLSLFLVHAAEIDCQMRPKFDIWKVVKFEGNYAQVLKVGGQSVKDQRHYPCLFLVIIEEEHNCFEFVGNQVVVACYDAI